MSQAGTAGQLEEDPVKARRAEGPGVAALQFCRGGAGSRKGQRAGRKDTGLRVHPAAAAGEELLEVSAPGRDEVFFA